MVYACRAGLQAELEVVVAVLHQHLGQQVGRGVAEVDGVRREREIPMVVLT